MLQTDSDNAGVAHLDPEPLGDGDRGTPVHVQARTLEHVEGHVIQLVAKGQKPPAILHQTPVDPRLGHDDAVGARIGLSQLFAGHHPGLCTEGQLQDPEPAADEEDALPPAYFLPVGAKGTDVVQLPVFSTTQDSRSSGWPLPTSSVMALQANSGGWVEPALANSMVRPSITRALYRDLDLGADHRGGVDGRNRGRNVQGEPYRADEPRDDRFDVSALQVGPMNGAALLVRPVELPLNRVQGDLHRPSSVR